MYSVSHVTAWLWFPFTVCGLTGLKLTPYRLNWFRCLIISEQQKWSHTDWLEMSSGPKESRPTFLLNNGVCVCVWYTYHFGFKYKLAKPNIIIIILK